MKRYEIIYLDNNEFTHKEEEKTLAVYGDRKELKSTLKTIKNYKIINIFSINNNEIYKKIKI